MASSNSIAEERATHLPACLSYRLGAGTFSVLTVRVASAPLDRGAVKRCQHAIARLAACGLGFAEPAKGVGVEQLLGVQRQVEQRLGVQRPTLVGPVAHGWTAMTSMPASVWDRTGADPPSGFLSQR